MIDIGTLEGTSADILVVDDVPESLRFRTAIPADRGYRARPASSGWSALESVASAGFFSEPVWFTMEAAKRLR